MIVTAIEALKIRRERAKQHWQEKSQADIYITIGMGTCGIAAGATETLVAIQEELKKRDIQAAISQVGCVGMCSYEPMIELQTRGSPRLNYGQATAKNVPEIFAAHLDGAALRNSVIVGQIAQTVIQSDAGLLHSLSFVNPTDGNRVAFHQKQLRIVLSNCGLIDPESIDDYLALDGYDALDTALRTMSPEQVIEEVLDSGLRGRGGAGFPTGMKWRFARTAPEQPKYIICNADESEPGTFKDRLILEGDPHLVLEGMALAGYAVGATEGWIYIRGEYALGKARLMRAVQQAEELGLLGAHIMGSDFSFHVHIHTGAGAYICGEETALLESMEGKRGIPRIRPPYPTQVGFRNQPTVINNVETLANIPKILLNGADWFRSVGTADSPGTRVFTILGDVNSRGVIEIPMGMTLREIITVYGGGMRDGKAFKCAQVGGASGSIMPPQMLDVPFDFTALQKHGVALGSGALLICDEGTCVVDLAYVLMRFFEAESCGKCTSCRLGTIRMRESLSRLCRGQGTETDIIALSHMAQVISKTAFCGLGQAVAMPILSALRHFREEVEAHTYGKCPARVCSMRVS